MEGRAHIREVFDKTANAEAPLYPGSHCRYCRARAICPALKDAVTKSLVPMGILSPGDSKAKRLGIVEARLAQVTDEQISQMLEAYGLINFIYDPIMDEARRRIQEGKLEDWKMAKPIERRKIVDSRKAISLLLLAGMSREDVMQCASLSITKVEDKARDYCNKDNKAARDYVTRHLSSVIETETGKSRVLRK
jgi:hypothetical protein